MFVCMCGCKKNEKQVKPLFLFEIFQKKISKIYKILQRKSVFIFCFVFYLLVYIICVCEILLIDK